MADEELKSCGICGATIYPEHLASGRAAVLKGQSYRGLAYVVNTWYLTAYEPLTDKAGNVIGMLYVGEKLEAVASLRRAIMGMKVGKMGYVGVIGGRCGSAARGVRSPDQRRHRTRADRRTTAPVPRAAADRDAVRLVPQQFGHLDAQRLRRLDILRRGRVVVQRERLAVQRDVERVVGA